jgi:3-dehydroquinate synthase
MKTIPNKQGPIWVGSHSDLMLQRIFKERPDTTIALITDHNVERDALPILQHTLDRRDVAVWSVPPGEASKQIGTCEQLWAKMAAFGLDRNSLLIALGGGTITDLAGFVAATYMRGIDYISIPTSLLAQVDAAIGGKTGVDLHHFKNYIGAFRPASHVLIDPRYLDTLPPRQWINGLAEMVKHALISGGDDWAFFVKKPSPKSFRWEEAIHRSASIKMHVVDQDPLESGLRKVLNLGHSIGHAIESTALEANIDVQHGEAVAAGLWCEAWLAHRGKLLPAGDFHEVKEVLAFYFEKIDMEGMDEHRMMHYLFHDKKNKGNQILISALNEPGKWTLDYPVTEAQALAAIRAYATHFGSNK